MLDHIVLEKIEVAREFVREGWTDQADAVRDIIAAADAGDFATVAAIELEY